MSNDNSNLNGTHPSPPNQLQSLIPDEHAPLLINPSSSPYPISSKIQRRTGLIQFLALCWSLFMIGWNDGSIGPLLPRIVQTFNVSYGTVSWIFVLACTGLVLGALGNMPLNDRFGYGKIIVAGALLQSLGFVIRSLGQNLPFPAFTASFFLGGIGMAIQDAQCNGYIALVKQDGELKMGLLQASYGFGALIAPISATQFARMPMHWADHYLISFIFSLTNVVVLVAVFRFRGQDECLRESGEVVPESVNAAASDDVHGNGESKYAQMLRLRAVHLLALFLILYIGVEVTIGGWIVTFMIVVRGGGPESGYIAAGFFGGLTLGRIVLIWVNQKLGEVRALYVYTALVIIAQLLVWITPSAPLNAFLICTIGLLLGPMYPIAIRHAARVIPRSLVTGAIGWIAACGAAGSAILPFFTGRIAEKLGIGSLMPFLVAMTAVMGAVWCMVPTKPAEDM